MQIQNLIYGIDFSGAKDVGKKIWIGKGIVKKKTHMHVPYQNDCR